jgi:hypothetical protein
MYSIRDVVVISFVAQAFDDNGDLVHANESNVKTANDIVDKVAELAGKLQA